MSDFDAHIRQRLSDASRSLDQARAMDDDYAVTLHLGELEGLSRIAADHGITVSEIDLGRTGGLTEPETA